MLLIGGGPTRVGGAEVGGDGSLGRGRGPVEHQPCASRADCRIDDQSEPSAEFGYPLEIPESDPMSTVVSRSSTADEKNDAQRPIFRVSERYRTQCHDKDQRGPGAHDAARHTARG